MSYKMRVEIIRRLVIRGFIPEAEVACEELKVSKKVLEGFRK